MSGPSVPEEIFDEAAIAKLAGLGKFPLNADLDVFRELLQAAAYFYLEDKREADDNTVWQEFAALHRAAASKKFVEAHRLLESASDRTRWLINYRAERLGAPWPPQYDLTLEEGRAAFCEALCSLLHYAGRSGVGRARKSGRRSTAYGWALFAPNPARHFKKREAERVFLERLRLAWREATGTNAPLEVHRDSPGPFARVLAECFEKMGTRGVDVVNLINRAKQ